MTTIPVSVFSPHGQELGASLSALVSGFQLEAGSEESCARIALVDGSDPAAPSAVVRLYLSDEDVPGRRPGDLVLPREVFLREPRRYLLLLSELGARSAELEELRDEMEFLKGIPALAAMNDSALVSEHITATILRVLAADAGMLLLHDPRTERFVISFATEGLSEPEESFMPGVGSHLLRTALDSGSYGLIEPTSEREGLLVLPIEASGDLIALIRIILPAGSQCDIERAELAMRYVRNVSAVLANVYHLTSSRELAMRDDLTKAYNRRFFESYLDEEIERSRRYGTFFSIIFLDLDDLKVVNDRHGHLAGSRTLQEVTKRVLGAIRGIDKLVRFGGDEFCIILPQTDQQQAKAVATRVQHALHQAPFRIEDDVIIPITASFGVATYPLHAVGKEDLVRSADAAMYEVKSTTKDAIGMAGPETLLRRRAATEPD